MYRERRCAHRYAFVASAAVADPSGERMARVEDLSIAGAYLAMPNPFSKGAGILVKIRTNGEYFQCHATVAHSTLGIGMGVSFRNISPPFLFVLQQWLIAAMQEQSAVIHRST
jgi:PilZ domain